MGYRILAREADLIICHTRWSADAVVRTYHPPGTIIVMTHGNLEAIYPVPRPRAVVAAELGLDPERQLSVVSAICAVQGTRARVQRCGSSFRARSSC